MIKFNRANRQPVPLQIDGKDYLFPRFNRNDWDELQTKIDALRLEEATRGMYKLDRARLLNLYPQEPLTRQGLYSYVYTRDVAAHIFKTCAARAGVDDETIADWVEGEGMSEVDIETVALMLASIVDPSEVSARMQENEARERAANGDADTSNEQFDQEGFPDETESEPVGETEDPDHPLHHTGSGSPISAAAIGT